MPNETLGEMMGIKWWEHEAAAVAENSGYGVAKLCRKIEERATKQEKERIRGIVEEGRRVRTPEQESAIEKFGDGTTYAQGTFNGHNEAIEAILSRLNEE